MDSSRAFFTPDFYVSLNVYNCCQYNSFDIYAKCLTLLQNRYDGNSFANGPAPLPLPYSPPPPGRSRHKHKTRPGTRKSPDSDAQSLDSDKGPSAGQIVGIVLGSLLLLVLVLLAVVFCIHKNKRKVSGARASKGSFSASSNDGMLVKLLYFKYCLNP